MSSSFSGENSHPLSGIGPLVFDDGNIVLQAGRETVKLHEGVLRRLSSVFDRMYLDNPTLSNSTAMVRLTDTPVDLLLYAKAIYNDDSTHTGSSPTPVYVICSLLRMSRKYNTPSLLHHITDRIRFEFPLTLQSWDCAEHFRGSRVTTDHNVLSLVTTLRNNDLLGSLPSLLFFICKTYTLDELRIGFLIQGRSSVLNHADFALCASARESLVNAQVVSTLAWLDPSETDWPNCQDSSGCKEILRKIGDSLWLNRTSLIGLDRWNIRWNDGLCAACRTTVMERHSLGRSKLWDSLPSHFDMEEWGALSQMEMDLLKVDVNIAYEVVNPRTDHA